MTSNPDTGAKLRSLYAADGGVTSVFTERVADYVASRPGYPHALFEALRANDAIAPGATVADVGSGTGLLTRDLLRNGYRVVAVEPNAEMRRASDLLLGGMDGYRSVEGCAESIPLAAASVDLITAAQAFHWFEIERARAEFLRVLTGQGQVALIWNDRALEDPVQNALDEIFAAFGGAKRAALVVHEDRSKVPWFFGSTQPRQFSWPNAHLLDERGLASLVFSRSYIPGRSTAEGSEIANRVRAVFERFAVNGQVEVRYRTIATLGRPA